MRNIFLFIGARPTSIIKLCLGSFIELHPEKYIGKSTTIESDIGNEYMAVTSDPEATRAAYEIFIRWRNSC